MSIHVIDSYLLVFFLRFLIVLVFLYFLLELFFFDFFFLDPLYLFFLDFFLVFFFFFFLDFFLVFFFFELYLYYYFVVIDATGNTKGAVTGLLAAAAIHGAQATTIYSMLYLNINNIY